MSLHTPIRSVRALRLFLGSGVLLFALSLQAQDQATTTPEASDIKQIVDGLMNPYLSERGAPGAIVAVSIHGRRYYFPYGSATDDGAPFTPTTLVEIGSCTKVFTTTLFALAIGRHQIAPDGSIQTYMPHGYTLQPLAQQVTPRELALFTSGLPDDPPNLPRQLEMRSIDRYTTRDFLHWITAWTPDSPPPAPYAYSNAGVGLLGYLVAEASQTPWDQQIHQEIAGPLGMVDTETSPSGAQRNRMAQGHRVNGMAAPAWPLYAWFAAGALRSTATDMLSFGEANLGHTSVAGHPVPAELTAAMKLAQTPVYSLPDGTAKQGMAWVTNEGEAGTGLAPEVLKNGGTVGFSSVILINPTKDIAIFIAVNKQGAKPAQLAVKLGRHLR